MKSLVAQRPLDLCELNVNMSNALARAAHGLTLSEKRIVAACIAQCDSKSLSESSRRGSWKVRLTALAYAELFELDPATAYAQLKSAAEQLFNRRFRLLRQTEDGPAEYDFRWVAGLGKLQDISGVKYHANKGWIEIIWDPEVAKHLFGLRREFISYKLRHTVDMRSVYSWRLYECLRSWQGTGQYHPTIEEFSHTMEVPAAYLTNFKYIRTRIIEPAVKEITEKNGMEIDWTTKTAGRKVTGLNFKFRFKPQMELVLEAPESAEESA